jgi:hypothetical protein
MFSRFAKKAEKGPNFFKALFSVIIHGSSEISDFFILVLPSYSSTYNL